MPTGYTGVIDDHDASFAEFAWGCMRAFGVCITMRDEPLGAAIPESFPVDSYHSDRVAHAKERRSRVEAMTDDECESSARSEYDDAFRAHEECVKRTAAMRARYQKMRVEVLAWQPPSENLGGLKTFMLEQLATGQPYEPIGWTTKRLTGAEWRAKKIERCVRDVEYHTKKHEEEVGRVGERNAMLADMRKSVPQPPPKELPRPMVGVVTMERKAVER